MEIKQEKFVSEEHAKKLEGWTLAFYHFQVSSNREEVVFNRCVSGSEPGTFLMLRFGNVTSKGVLSHGQYYKPGS